MLVFRNSSVILVCNSAATEHLFEFLGELISTEYVSFVKLLDMMICWSFTVRIKAARYELVLKQRFPFPYASVVDDKIWLSLMTKVEHSLPILYIFEQC